MHNLKKYENSDVLDDNLFDQKIKDVKRRRLNKKDYEDNEMVFEKKKRRQRIKAPQKTW